MPTWIRVRADDTGHEFDVAESALGAGVTPVPDYPPNSGPGALPRPAKHFVAKDGRAAKPRQKPAPPPPPPPDPDKAPSTEGTAP